MTPHTEIDEERGVAAWLPASPRIALFLVIAAVGAAPLAFASVEPWASSWLLVLCASAFLAASWDGSPKRVFSGTAGAIALPALVLIAWAAVQTLPLPRPIVSALSPKVSSIQTTFVPKDGGAGLPSLLLDRARSAGAVVRDDLAVPPGIADAGSRSASSSLSIDPFGTRRAIFAWLAPILLFLAARRVAEDRFRRYRLLWGIAGWTGLLGAIAVLQRVAGNGRMLWIRESPPWATPIGPFVNPNHYAGWVEMGLLVTLGLGLAVLGGTSRRLSFEQIRQSLLDRDWALPRLLLLGGAVVLAMCGMMLSQSRGALMALAAGALVLLPLRWMRQWLPAAVGIVVLVGLGVGLASWLGGERQTLQTAFFGTAGRDPSLAMRSDIWGRTVRILADHPLTGTGLGTFRHAYAAYEREGEWLSTDQAHNDYLQLLAETGAPGAILLAWWVVAVVRRMLRPALRHQAAPAPWTTAALAAALFAMLCHSILDFSLQIPAVASLFAVVGGALAAAAEDPPAAPDGEAA